jgi:hypothetical protein
MEVFPTNKMPPSPAVAFLEVTENVVVVEVVEVTKVAEVAEVVEFRDVVEVAEVTEGAEVRYYCKTGLNLKKLFIDENAAG